MVDAELRLLSRQPRRRGPAARALSRSGLVLREAQPVNPPRVDYELTPLGREVAARLLSLIHFLEGSMDEVLASRERYDATRGAR